MREATQAALCHWPSPTTERPCAGAASGRRTLGGQRRRAVDCCLRPLDCCVGSSGKPGRQNQAPVEWASTAGLAGTGWYQVVKCSAPRPVVVTTHLHGLPCALSDQSSSVGWRTAAHTAKATRTGGKPGHGRRPCGGLTRGHRCAGSLAAAAVGSGARATCFLDHTLPATVRRLCWSESTDNGKARNQRKTNPVSCKSRASTVNMQVLRPDVIFRSTAQSGQQRQ